MKAPRWTAVSASAFEWEREALDYARAYLPDHEPWRAWSNFEFIDDEGRVNEVDLLVLTPAGLILIEVKSRPGTVKGDAASWTWVIEGRLVTTDNPLPLANRKAKRLGSVLRRQAALGGRAPWVESLIFLSKIDKPPLLDPGTAKRVVLRGRPGEPDDPGLIGVLLHAEERGFGRRGTVDANGARGIVKAIEQAGIRPPGRGRRVGDYELGQLLTEGPDWKDYVAKHTATGAARRVRIYPYAHATPEERDRMARTAKREFAVLEGVDYLGIQRALDLREAELGPALVFDYDPEAVRLDGYLAQNHARLPLAERLGLIRQLGEAMAYAHGKRIYHRGLAPQNVLIHPPVEGTPRLQVINWQVATRGAGAGATTLGTRHPDDRLSDAARVYAAPEANDDSADGASPSAARADVFSMGALAYLIVSGQAPARGPLDMPALLREGNGLRLSAVVNGVGKDLEDFVRIATAPMVRDRPRDGREFLDYLALAEDEARPREPAPAALADPTTAAKGDLLENNLVFVRRLGTGGTAIAALVHRSGDDDASDLVLKIATDPAHADRIRAEADALRRLRHPNIVRLVDELSVAGRPALLMERAGDRTLAQWIRGGDPLSLDLMRRFGEHLIQAVEQLEETGVAHRDIKPDNIGVAKVGASGAYRLVLFDFSLTRAPAENISAGTRPYLDPFLTNRRPPRWDQHAERYAASITLHEMLAGGPPVYGDGSVDPIATDDDATIALDRFDPALRDTLCSFFRRAFQREATERFGNAEEMLREWRRAFAPMDRTAEGPESIEVVARRLQASSTMTEVGYGLEARAVLNDRMGIHTVRQLLAVPRQKFRYLTGVGDRIRREIREQAKALAGLRPDLVPGGTTADTTAASGHASIDRLAEQLIARRPAGDERPEDRILARLLAIEEDASFWPTAGDVAAASQTARSTVADVLEAARDRWHKSRDLNEVRTELATLVAEAGGVAAIDELAAQLLASRGSVQEDEAERMRRARAIIRAAVELEAANAPTRFRAYADTAPVLIARSARQGNSASSPDGADLAEYARRLGRAADKVAADVPLPSPARVDDELGLVPLPHDVTALPPDRTRRLAAAASANAALSSRLELYPRSMPALMALRLSLGALTGPKSLSMEEIQARVRGRFPEAEALPGRPALDVLLLEAGAERDWRSPLGEAPGYYGRTVVDAASGGATPTPPPVSTQAAPVEPTEDVLSARMLEEKIAHAARTGSFLALTVEPPRAARAEAELAHRFPREVISLERLVLQAMRAEAAARRVQWPVALAADASPRTSADFRNLLRLAARAAPRVQNHLLALRTPALLTRPGLLARYELMDLLNALSQASGATGGPPSLWLLVPQPDRGLPHIDSTVLPVISSANWAWLSPVWLANAHRAGGRAAA